MVQAIVFRVVCALHFSIPFLAVPASAAGKQAPQASPDTHASSPTTVETIRAEATRSAVGEGGRPLPLIGTWNVGIFEYTGPDRPRGAEPAWQLEQIEKGHRYLPVFAMPEKGFEEGRWTDHPYGKARFDDYLHPAFEKVKELGLPFSLLGSQWERHLTKAGEYLDLPPGQNPNVVTPGGEILKMVDPFGPTELWYELGAKLTDNPVMDRLQEIYPDPPMVLFVSNNEHDKLRWTDVERSKRYLEKFGEGRSDEFKRKAVGDAWIEKYRALLKGMREGLKSETWKDNSRFIGYGGDVGMEAMGRWPGWTAYSLHTTGRPNITPYMWDGASPSYYMHNWSDITDYQVMSNQIHGMNMVSMLQDAFEINPDFWFEISVWDGDLDDEKLGYQSKLTTFRQAGQSYDMDRYRGWLQFGLWLHRPRLMRLWDRGWTAGLDEFAHKLDQFQHVTGVVHENETLRAYWRHGEVVRNPKGTHPFQTNIPGELAIKPRWFLLDTSLTPKRPWKLSTEIPVFPLALQLGEAPDRSWLVYAHAPLEGRQDVRIDIPDFGSITVDVPREGVFYEVREMDGSVRQIELPVAPK